MGLNATFKTAKEDTDWQINQMEHYYIYKGLQSITAIGLEQNAKHIDRRS